jgi:hypothetical protein
VRFPALRFSRHFEKDRSRRSDRREITIEKCQRVIEVAVKEEPQDDGSINFWGYVEERDRYLKVAVNPEVQEVITAHFDRVFRRKVQRGENP